MKETNHPIETHPQDADRLAVSRSKLLPLGIIHVAHLDDYRTPAITGCNVIIRLEVFGINAIKRLDEISLRRVREPSLAVLFDVAVPQLRGKQKSNISKNLFMPRWFPLL